MPSPTDIYKQTFAPAFTNNSIPVAATTTTSSAQYDYGLYIVKTDAECHIRQGASGVVATTSSFLLEPGVAYPLRVDSTSNDYIALLSASGTANVQLTLLA